MNAADITEAERILGLCEKATPGPWIAQDRKTTHCIWGGTHTYALATCDSYLRNANGPTPEDRANNAAAIAELPRLASLLRLALRENEGMRHAVECIAKQKFAHEFDEDLREDADYEAGYTACVQLARAALAGLKEAQG